MSKELLEQIIPITECLQGWLQEVYFDFQKVDEIKDHYKHQREKANAEHDKIYHKNLNLNRLFGSNESMPCVIRGIVKPYSEFTIRLLENHDHYPIVRLYHK